MKKRLFIAVDISDAARKAAAEHIYGLRARFSDVRASWVKPENLHLTLKFLGDVEKSRIDEIVEASRLSVTQVGPFLVSIGGTGAFPSPRNPKVLWLGIEDKARYLSTLAKGIDSSCERIGFPKDQKPFRPHLTIARIRTRSHKLRELAAAHDESDFKRIEFEVFEAVLYESELRRGRSIYTPITRQTLSR